MSKLILIINDGGARLCKDGRWRGFANFGTMSSCVKTFKRLSAAKKMARRVWGRVVVVPSDETVERGRVVVVPSDETVERCVEASGMVIERRSVADKPGYENVTHATLCEFEVA